MSCFLYFFVNLISLTGIAIYRVNSPNHNSKTKIIKRYKIIAPKVTQEKTIVKILNTLGPSWIFFTRHNAMMLKTIGVIKNKVNSTALAKKLE